MAEFQVNKQKVAKNTIAMYIRMAITMVISFFTARITLQQLGVEDYGLNNLVGSVVTFMGFLSTSIATAMQRFYSIEIGKGDQGDLRRVFGTGLFLHTMIALVTALMLEVFAVFFLEKMNIPADRMFAAHVVFQVSIVQFAITILTGPFAAMLRAKEKFDKMALLDVAQSVLRLGVLFLLIRIGYDKLITLSFLNMGVSLLYTGGILYLAWRIEETHTRPNRDKKLLKELFSFVSILIVSTLASLGRTQGLIMLINLFFGLAVNAAYAVAAQVSHIVNNFVQNFKSAMVPQMMAAYGAGDKTTMHKFVNFGTKITATMMLLISLPVIFESNFILKIWLGNPPEFAAELVSLVIININISQLTYFHYQGIHASGKITLNQTILTGLYIITLLIYYVAFKLGGSFYSAMYINFVISGLIVANGLYFAHRLYDYDIVYFLNQVLMPLLIITVITVVGLMALCHFMEPSLWRALIVFTFSTLLLGGFGWLILLNRDEREKLMCVVRKNR